MFFLDLFRPAASKTQLFTILGASQPRKTPLFTTLGASQPRKHCSRPARRRLCACSAPPVRSNNCYGHARRHLRARNHCVGSVWPRLYARNCCHSAAWQPEFENAVTGLLGATCVLGISAPDLLGASFASEMAECFNEHRSLIHFTAFLIAPCMDMRSFTLYSHIYAAYVSKVRIRPLL